MTLEEIKELMALLESSPLHRIELAYEDGKVVLEKAPQAAVAAVPAPAVVPAAAVPEPPESEQIVEITAPMVGTFYRAPDPQKPPFVKIGSQVMPNTVVCILEAMKLFSEVEALVEGEIVDILVKDGEFVEFGQPLFKVKKGHAV